MTSFFRITSLFLFSISLFSCGGGGSGGGSGNEGAFTTPAPGVTLRCGIVRNQTFSDTVDLSSSIQVTVQAISGDTFQITELNNGVPVGSRLVKLHGVSATNPFTNNLAFQRIQALFANASGFLIDAGSSDECQIVTDGGGLGTLAQLFTSNGQSVVELLLSEGTVAPTTNGCSAEALQACYTTISNEAVSSKRITDFLWKPVSERNGNLVVLVDPAEVSVVVTGASQEVLTDTGPSNGRGTTARSVTGSGASFGTNITVEFFDTDGKKVLLNNGESTVTISNGSERVRLFF